MAFCLARQHPMKMGDTEKLRKFGDFWPVGGCHEHGMDRDPPFDDGPGAFKLQTPLARKGDP
jgi:hypothetical protein